MVRKKHEQQGDLSPLVIRHIDELIAQQAEIQQRLIASLPSAREFANSELSKAFDYAILRSREWSEGENIDPAASLRFFVSSLSDVLNVKVNAILTALEMLEIDIGMAPVVESSHEVFPGIDAGIDSEAVNEIPIQHCQIYTRANQCITVIKGAEGQRWHLKKGPVGFDLVLLSEDQLHSLEKYKVQTLSAYLQAWLPGYQSASYLYRNHLFHHWGGDVLPP